MMKTLLAAAAAVSLISGASLADSAITHSKTESTTSMGASGTGGSRDVDIHKSVRSSADGTVVEKDKTVKRTGDAGDAHVTLQIGRDHDHDVENKEKMVTKSTEISPTGNVTKKKSETTTIR